MKCTFTWCTEKRNPAIGIANLSGQPVGPMKGLSGTYPLCAWHYGELTAGRWPTVRLDGWEELPQEEPEVVVGEVVDDDEVTGQEWLD